MLVEPMLHPGPLRRARPVPSDRSASRGWRPPPLSRASATEAWPASSLRARPIVLAAMPVACDTAATPPYRQARPFTAAASKRRSRSSRCNHGWVKRSRIGSGSLQRGTLVNSFLAIFRVDPRGKSAADPQRIRRRLCAGLTPYPAAARLIFRTGGTATGGTVSSGLFKACSSASRSWPSFRSFSIFSPKTSLT